MDQFQGQVAVITGAASGIGKALAAAASSRGMNLLLADRNVDGLSQVRTALQKPGQKVLALQTDVSREQDLEKLAETARREFGQVNLLFNNAGVCPIGLTWDTSAQDWAKAFDINVMGVVHGHRAFLPLMMSQSGPARIVNTGSIAGLFSNPGGVAYAATKHAVIALSEGLSMELQAVDSQVRVSVICPGFVNTNLGRPVDAAEKSGELPDSVREGRESLQRTLALGLSPDELAERVFAGIDDDLFWIFTQPEMLEGFDLRCSSIRNLTDPVFIPVLE